MDNRKRDIIKLDDFSLEDKIKVVGVTDSGSEAHRAVDQLNRKGDGCYVVKYVDTADNPINEGMSVDQYSNMKINDLYKALGIDKVDEKQAVVLASIDGQRLYAKHIRTEEKLTYEDSRKIFSLITDKLSALDEGSYAFVIRLRTMETKLLGQL